MCGAVTQCSLLVVMITEQLCRADVPTAGAQLHRCYCSTPGCTILPCSCVWFRACAGVPAYAFGTAESPCSSCQSVQLYQVLSAVSMPQRTQQPQQSLWCSRHPLRLAISSFVPKVHERGFMMLSVMYLPRSAASWASSSTPWACESSRLCFHLDPASNPT